MVYEINSWQKKMAEGKSGGGSNREAKGSFMLSNGGAGCTNQRGNGTGEEEK